MGVGSPSLHEVGGWPLSISFPSKLRHRRQTPAMAPEVGGLDLQSDQREHGGGSLHY